MELIKPGDVAIYDIIIRNKATGAEEYHVCEVVAALKDGVPINASNVTLNGIRAIFMRRSGSASPSAGRVLVPKSPGREADNARLKNDLTRVYGPGELFSGFVCKCHRACSLK